MSNQRIQKLQDRVEYWEDKYHQALEEKYAALDKEARMRATLVSALQSGLDRRQWAILAAVLAE